MEGELSVTRALDATEVYHLCNKAESRMRRALKQRRVILVGETLLLKFEGRLAALAVRDEGIFKEGFWYCPYGKRIRALWRGLYQTGVLTYPYLSGPWVEVRFMRGRAISSPSVQNEIAKLKETDLDTVSVNARSKRTKQEKVLGVDAP